MISQFAEQVRYRALEIQRVKDERKRTEPHDPWWPIPAWEVPAGVRFDVPRHAQGQIVERAYGTFGRSEAGETDPYMRVADRSDQSVRTYKRRQVS